MRLFLFHKDNDSKVSHFISTKHLKNSKIKSYTKKGGFLRLETMQKRNNNEEEVIIICHHKTSNNEFFDNPFCFFMNSLLPLKTLKKKVLSEIQNRNLILEGKI